MSRSLSRTYFSRRVKRILSMKAGNLPDLIKYLTVIYFSLFSVFLCYTDDARITEFRKYAVQSNSYGIINYNIHSQALSAMSNLLYTGGDFMQILIIEDEKRLADALGQIMQEARYQADIVYDGRDGLAYASSGDYDVIVLDVMLPGMDGFEVVHHLRESKISTPVIMLTALDDVKNKITGLDSGADDYMTKPFVPEELLARIRALSRRQGEVILEELTFDDLTLNLSSNDLSCKNKSIHLGYKEFEILKILMSNPKILISKETLIVKVWGAESAAESNNVEAYISFLRKKFHYLDSKVTIGTVRKVGYRLESEETS